MMSLSPFTCRIPDSQSSFGGGAYNIHFLVPCHDDIGVKIKSNKSHRSCSNQPLVQGEGLVLPGLGIV